MTEEWWAVDGTRAVIDYDDADRVVIQGDMMRLLLVAAGYTREKVSP